MNTLAELFESGAAIDLVIAIVLAELVVFAALKRWRIVVGLVPGLCLILALRFAVTGVPWIWIAAFLTLSLPAHLWDLALRMRRHAVTSSS